jgi:hypothetical protein
MASLFRPDPEDDDDDEAADGGVDLTLLTPLPEFALIASAAATDGWHMAAVVGESGDPAFYVRAVTVRWPFLIARPAPSNRISDKPVDRERLSPTGTTPARKLVVNWPWITVEERVAQLRFYVKRTAPALFRKSVAVTVRLTLKESAWPRRRIVVPLHSNSISWNVSEPATPPASGRRSA